MKKLFLCCLLLPALVLAQKMKIKNGTEFVLVEVQMNYEDHSTGNLLDAYNNKKALKPGETFTLPHCNTFGAGDPMVFNVSATDADKDLYLFGEVDICKTPQIVIEAKHLFIDDPESNPSEEDVYSDSNPMTNQIRYDDFVQFVEKTFGPALKAGSMALVKAQFSQRIREGLGVSVAGQTTFTQAMLNKAKIWYTAGKTEQTPRAPFGSFEFSKKLYPVLYVGEDLNTEGIFFVFDREGEGEDAWKIEMIMDAPAFQSYAAVLDGELDELADEVTTEGDQNNEALQEYEQFMAWMEAQLLPVLKSSNYNKFTCLFGDDCDTNVTQPVFLKLVRFFAQTGTFEAMPNENMDFTEAIDPVIFFGIHYNEDNEDGFYLNFRRVDQGEWRIRKVTPAKELK